MVFVGRSALHVGVGVVVYLADAGFLGLAECLGVLDALAQGVRQTAYQIEVSLCPFYLILADCILCGLDKLLVGIIGHASCVPVLLGGFKAVTKCFLLGLAAGYVLHIIESHIEAGIL